MGSGPDDAPGTRLASENGDYSHSVLESLSLPFVQRALVEVLVLAVLAGALGTWIVLRGLAFYSHAVAAAAFPGLVLADGLGFSPLAGAGGTAVLVAVLVGRLSLRRTEGHDSATALALIGALSVGIILASDVFGSGAQVDALLFGSLLAVTGSDMAFAAGVTALAVVASAWLGPRWLALGFDAGSARSLGIRSTGPDLALLGLVALAAIACLAAVGSLLATALLVVPAATTRVWCDRMGAWQLTTGGLAALEGAVGVWLAFELNAPPGSTIAVLSGAVFVAAVASRAPGAARNRNESRYREASAAPR